MNTLGTQPHPHPPRPAPQCHPSGPGSDREVETALPTLTVLSPPNWLPRCCQHTSVLMSPTGSKKNTEEQVLHMHDANSGFSVSSFMSITQLPSSTPSARSRINSVEFLSILFRTQVRHLPASEEKQVLEHSASEQPVKTTTSRMCDTWLGFPRENRRKGRNEADKTELREGPLQPV